MTPPAPRDTTPHCQTCGWTGKTTTAGIAAHALRLHSCAKKRREDAATARDRARLAAVDRTPKPCLHKQARHQHGTYACYTLDHCRCLPCATAHSRYEADRRKRAAYGRGDLIDARPVRAHVAKLEAAGVGLKRVAKLSGVPQGALWKLMYGKKKPDGSQTPSLRVRRDTARKLLAVKPTLASLAGGAVVDSCGTRRRLQALVACGWSVGQLAAQSHLDRQRLDGAIKGRHVVADTARRVADLYEKLWDAPPPENDHRSRIAANRSRNRARANGWPPPLAWDDDVIDDPDAHPDVTPIERPNRVVHVDDVEWLVRAGGTWESIAARLGVTKNAVATALRRAERHDLTSALSGQVSA